MNLSIFDVVGPVMVGPSSSHTAGAARLARIARMIAGGPVNSVSFGLSGSFAKTYKGHGTDKALVAGALGLAEDDERLVNAYALAAKAGIAYDFHEVELEGMHENTVEMRFFMQDGSEVEVVGSSIGGGNIRICHINGFETDFSAQNSTLIIRQNDKKGIVSTVTGLLAESGINIGVMMLSRKSKGGTACCIIEVDGNVPSALVAKIKEIDGVCSALALNISQEVATGV